VSYPAEAAAPAAVAPVAVVPATPEPVAPPAAITTPEVTNTTEAAAPAAVAPVAVVPATPEPVAPPAASTAPETAVAVPPIVAPEPVASAPAATPANPTPPALPATVPAAVPAAPASTAAAATAESADIDPKPRIVTREGIVRKALNVKAPADYELHDLNSGQIIEYLQAGGEDKNLKKYAGLKVLVTGPESVDWHWPKTPILQTQTVYIMP
jgi:hypothetical protein